MKTFSKKNWIKIILTSIAIGGSLSVPIMHSYYSASKKHKPIQEVSETLGRTPAFIVDGVGTDGHPWNNAKLGIDVKKWDKYNDPTIPTNINIEINRDSYITEFSVTNSSVFANKYGFDKYVPLSTAIKNGDIANFKFGMSQSNEFGIKEAGYISMSSGDKNLARMHTYTETPGQLSSLIAGRFDAGQPSGTLVTKLPDGNKLEIFNENPFNFRCPSTVCWRLPNFADNRYIVVHLSLFYSAYNPITKEYNGLPTPLSDRFEISMAKTIGNPMSIRTVDDGYNYFFLITAEFHQTVVDDDFHLHCFSNDFVYNQTNSVLMETPAINKPDELTNKEFTNIGGMKIFGEDVFNDITDLIFPSPIDSIYEKLRNGKYTATTTGADGWQSKYSNNKLLGAVRLNYQLPDMITLVQFDGTPFEKTMNNDRLTFFDYSFDIKPDASLPVDKKYYDFSDASTGKILDTSFYKEWTVNIQNDIPYVSVPTFMDWIYVNDANFTNIESKAFYKGCMLLKQGDQTLYRLGISHRYFDINDKDA